ncbi:alpha-N-acetylglucosaminidase [Streptomyces sp. NPDC002490]|uniref:alpha-N-acetylglucosaminidase n=1 Tax=Streptomyces sp. NPDC002490 TaxID=3154416 RepID=UPI00332FA7DF
MPLPRRALLRATALGTTGVALAGLAPSPSVGAPAPADGDGAAARAARRLLPRHADQFVFRALPAAAESGGADAFGVFGERGRIVLAGTTPAVRLTALRWYLKHTAHAHLGWAGEQLDLPQVLPAPPADTVRTARVPHRFALNDTNDGYTGAYRDWAYWEREVDVLALHGYNRVFVQLGAEAVHHRVFQDFGYTGEEVRAWLPGPAHQPWWLLQNLSGFPAPPSRRLIGERAALGRRICDRLRELGMEPVLPGWSGMVPPGFADRNPGARTIAQGEWYGFDRPDWLDPRTGVFARVAAAYYAVQREVFGSTAFFKTDLLHEGGTAGDVPVGEAARAVQRALRAARPDAVWVTLGWRTNPPREVVEAVDREGMLVVDGVADRLAAAQDREAAWGGTPYAYGSIWNFGGHTVLGANAREWVRAFPERLARPGGALRGTALLPEAADNNPAAFELFSELAWSDGPTDLGDWFARWAHARYGEPDPKAAAAWDRLRRTVYGTTREDGWSEGADGLFGARPSLTAVRAARWSPKAVRYDPAEFAPALGELLEVRPGLRNSSAYRRDLLDVARQVLANRSRTLLPEVRAAYEARDAGRFEALSGHWLDLMDLLERLLATDGAHLLGRHLAEARSWGGDAAERERLAYDALSLITVWGPRRAAAAGLRDYGNREWAGLVGGLYRQRWSRYFADLAEALRTGRAPVQTDWYAVEEEWTRSPGPLATAPRGSTHAVATEVYERVVAER